MTQRVGIIGWPVEHSLSPAMHNAAFRALGLDWQYDAMAIPPDIAHYGVLEPRRHGYIGLNVTVPYKERALGFCQPDEKARAVGAVNTIDLRADTGTNTDVDGLIDDLLAHGVLLDGQRVIVLGAGGAARAAVYGLSKQGAEVAVLNRTPARAQAMLDQLRHSASIKAAQVLDMVTAAAYGPSLVINCTSAGMWPHVEETPWPEDVPFPAGVTLYDMVYRPARTRLMQQAEAAGGRAIGGLGMLVRQGAAAFKIWTGLEAPVEVMMAAVKQALNEKNDSKT